jgi:hypothetical protein
MRTKFWLESPKRRNHSDDLGVDEITILKWIIREVSVEGVDWINPAQDTDRWRDIVRTVINLPVS